MRLLPIAALLLLAACGNHTEPGLATGAPGVDVAEAALRGGSPQVALQIDNAILAKDPQNVPALLNRGDVETTQQMLDQAASSYAAALKLDPGSVPARIGLGRLRLTDDPATAERLFLEVLQRDPHNAVALNNLGIARDLQGRHQDAQSAYREAMGNDPTMIGARVNLALSLAMTGRADDAAPMLRPLADAPAAPRKYRHDMAAILAMGGDRDGAQRILVKDMSPEQANQAVAIFTAASGPMPPVALGPSPATVAATPAGTVMVQLDSKASIASAEAEWQRLRRLMPGLLTNRQPTLARVEQGGHAHWQVLTGGFASPAEAAAFCDAVRSKRALCAISGT